MIFRNYRADHDDSYLMIGVYGLLFMVLWLINPCRISIANGTKISLIQKRTLFSRLKMDEL